MVESDEVLQEEIEFEASHDDLERMPQAIPQAVPPHPPSPNLVEAAIADAEAKQVPAAPPEASET
ncbi:MAG: hypothetical protein HC780_12820 [Leptolyngbyaceae cyanobacterium CSU_1_3]|nr:hypothetical protein [Leptolyngbyaceae cyanobacterium CSU_1_3]